MSSPSPVVAFVPVRSPGRGKTRLASRLDPPQRAELAAAMLRDVVAALRASALDDIVILAGGPGSAGVARSLDLDVLLDPPDARGLDDAVAAATARVDRHSTVLVVMADLPRLEPADVSSVLEQDGAVVVAPTDDGGTGALLRRPPDAIATAYGPDSAARHARLGREAGHPTVVADLPGFRQDVDTWRDVDRLRTGPLGAHTAAFLRQLGERAAADGTLAR